MNSGRLTLLFPFFRKYGFWYIFGIIVLVIVDLLQVVIPKLIGRAIDDLAVRGEDLGRYLTVIIIVAVSIAVLRFVYRVMIMGTTRRLEYYLREQLFFHALRMPMDYFDRRGPGGIMALATNDANSVRMAVGLGIIILTDAVVMGIAALGAMASSINVRLTIFSTLPLPVILLTATFTSKLVHNRFCRVQEKFSELTEFSQEVFAGLKVIKSYAVEERFIHRFSEFNRRNMKENMALVRLQAIYLSVVHLAPLLCYVIAIFYGGVLVIDRRLTIGDLTAFLAYLGLIIGPVMGLGYLMNIMQRGFVSLGRLAEVIAETFGDQKLTGRENVAASGAITIKNLTFNYPAAAKPSLTGISISISPGMVVGIVGRTGSGKSTLLKLILRLYEAPAGSIFIGGHDIRTINLLTLRQSIGYVPQDLLLFSRTIAENIAFDKIYTRPEIRRAATLAAIEDDIDARPAGLEDNPGEKGKCLSGGQQQRVAIARAVIKNPALFLLDDIFSALDTDTQAELLANLKEFGRESTVLLVSQRIRVVKEADIIIVLDNGRVVEQGSHPELVRKQGAYYKMYKQQIEQVAR